MAGFGDFATGFVERINVQHEEKRKARREYDKLVDQSLMAGRLKAFETDRSAYDINNTLSSNVDAAISSGQGDMVIKALAGANKDLNKADRAAMVARVNQLSGPENREALREYALNFVGAKDQTQPDINDPKYQKGYSALRKQLMKEAPDDQHIFFQMRNKHNRNNTAMNANAELDKMKAEKAKQELTDAEMAAPKALTFPKVTPEFEGGPTITLTSPSGEVRSFFRDTKEVQDLMAADWIEMKPKEQLPGTTVAPGKKELFNATTAITKYLQDNKESDFAIAYDQADAEQKNLLKSILANKVAALSKQPQFKGKDLSTIGISLLKDNKVGLKMEDGYALPFGLGYIGEDITVVGSEDSGPEDVDTATLEENKLPPETKETPKTKQITVEEYIKRARAKGLKRQTDQQLTTQWQKGRNEGKW